MKNKGKLYVISGPSGVGKGTICKELVKNNDNITVSVSATTRKPRTEDKEGITYFFKTQQDFKQMIDDGEFLEWAIYNNNYYGTPVFAVEEKLGQGFDVILEIEAQGALSVMEKCEDSVSIFVEPPNEEILYQRLKGRGTENEEEIQKRIEAAKWELSQKDKYNYVVVNDKLEEAVATIENIMKNERKKN